MTVQTQTVPPTQAPLTSTTTTEARNFLGKLFGTIPDDSALEIRVKSNGATAQRFYTSVHEVTLDAPDGSRVWFGTCLRRRGKTGKAADVTWAPAAWADVDGVDAKEVLARARRVVPPTFAVDSGGGAHLYWKLDKPLDVTVDQRAAYLREVIHGLAGQVGGDHVHDLSRVLGVVGTMNGKYSPPRKVKLIHADPGRVYTVSDLARHRKTFAVPVAVKPATPANEDAPRVDDLRIPPKLRRLVKDGYADGCGYKSRSELDMAVCVAMLAADYGDDDVTAVFADPDNSIGDKYREKGDDGPRYLATTLNKARAYLAQQAAVNTLPPIKLDSGQLKGLRDNGVYRLAYAGELKPVARIGDGPDAVWEVEVPGGARVTLDAKSFASSYNLKCALPPVAAWTGTDADAQNLIPYFATFEVPRRTAVTVVGWHDDRVVYPNAVLGPDGIEEASQLAYRGEHPAQLTLVPGWPDLARELPRFLDLHARSAMCGLLGWFLATFAAPNVRRITGGGFPLLNVWGTTGAGKTTTLNLLWRLTGSTRTLLSAGGGSTAFTKTANLAATNTVPVIYDEHRAGNGLARLYETLREAYQASEHERGRADLGVTRLTLSAPVVVSGESALPEPALRQRSLIVRLSPQAITDATRETKRHVEGLPLLDFTGGAYQHVRGKLAAVPALWAEERARSERVGLAIDDDRKRCGLVVPLVGLRLFDEFLAGVDLDDAARGLAKAYEEESSQETSTVTEIVTAIFRLAQEHKLRNAVDFRVEKVDEVRHLFLNPTTSLGVIESYFRRERSELPITSRDAIREALRQDCQRGGGVVVSMRSDRRLDKKVTHAIELDLSRVAEATGIPADEWCYVREGL
jgi:hypothetical protein